MAFNKTSSNNSEPIVRKASFSSDLLEPRILMSATWVDAEPAQEQVVAPEATAESIASDAQEIFDGLEDRDDIFGEKGKEDALRTEEKEHDANLMASKTPSLEGTDRDEIKSDRGSEHNFIKNGSFEKYSGDSLKSGEWRAFKQLDGWNLDQGPQFEVVEADHGNVGATDGNHWLDTDASPGNIAFSQKVDGLVDSESYKLSFDTMSRGGEGSGTLVAFWNGEKVGVIEGSKTEGWKTNSFEVVAGSGDGTNTLRFAEFGRVDNMGTALDNVRLVGNLDQDDSDRTEHNRDQARSFEIEEKSKTEQNEKSSSTVVMPFERIEADRHEVKREIEHNFITNGSFEKYSGSSLSSGEWRGLKQLEGWSLNGGPQFEVVNADHGKVGATDGSNWLDTDASPGNISFSQKVEGLTNSETYKLSFDTRSRGAEGTGVLVAYWNGEKIGVAEGTFNDGWKTNSFEVKAGSGDGTNTLRFAELGRVDNVGTALDNVRLVATNSVDPVVDTPVVNEDQSGVSDEQRFLQKSLEQFRFALGETSILAGSKVEIHTALPAGVNSSDLQVRITGVPTGAQLSAGTEIGGGEWRMSGDELKGLTLATGSVFSGEYDIKVEASLKSPKPLYSESFEKGADGWSKPTTVSASGLTEALGRFGGTGGEQAIFKSFKAPEGVSSVIVEFDFLELDSWDGEKFQVFANDELVSNQSFFTHWPAYAADGNKTDSVALDSGTKNVAFSGWADQRHRYTIEVPVENGVFKLGFGSTLDQAIDDESFAIDNLVVFANHSTEASIDLSIKHSVAMVPAVNGDLADGPVTVTLDVQTSSSGSLGEVRIDNVPSSVTLSAGSKLPDGSWSLTAAQATKFQVLGEYEGTAELTVRSSFTTEGTLYEESFDKGASGWNNNSVTNGGDALGSFLGRVSEMGSNKGNDQTIFKTFDAPSGVTSVRVEFDFLELDSWDGEKFQVFANDKLVSSQSFFTHWPKYAADSDKADSVALDSGEKNLGLGGWADQRHRYAIEVPVENGQFKIGFSSTLDQNSNDESWGIDNLKVVASQTVETATSFSIQSRMVLGADGNDTLVASAKAEAFNGKAGVDTVDYSNSKAGVTVKLADTDGSGPIANQKSGGVGGDAAGDSYRNIENVIGSSKDDIVYGATTGSKVELGDGNDVFDNRATVSATDIVRGGNGNDRVWTGAGNDVIFGDKGDDQLAGEGGNDVIDGGDGFDQVSFSGRSGDYSIVRNPDGSFAVSDLRPNSPNGVDQLTNVETLAFSDGLYSPDMLAKPFAPIQLDSASAQPNRLTVHLGGELGNNRGQVAEPPKYEIWANGERVAVGVVDLTTMNRIGSQESPFRAINFEVAPGQKLDNVSVRFTNDAFEGKSETDRNLYVDAIVVNGQRLEAEGPQAQYHRGTSQVKGQEGMFWSGTLSFDTSNARQSIDAIVAENVEGAVIGKLSALNDSAADFKVSDDRFEVIDSVLKLKSGVSIDFEKESELEFSVSTSSQGQEWGRSVRLSIADVTESSPTPIVVVDDPVIPTPVVVDEPVTPTPIVVVDDPVIPAPVIVVDDPVIPTPVVIEDPVIPTSVVVVDDSVVPTPTVVDNDSVAPQPVLVIDNPVNPAPAIRSGDSLNPTDPTLLGTSDDRKPIDENLADLVDRDDENARQTAQQGTLVDDMEGNVESIRTNADINRTAADLTSLLSEFDRVLDQSLSSDEDRSADQTYTLQPADRVDWTGVEFADLVESSFGQRALVSEESIDGISIDGTELADEAKLLAEEKVSLATAEDQTSTLSRLWSLVRAYGGLRTKS